MTVKISSIGLKGLQGYRVQVEVQITHGTGSMVIFGLPDASVEEWKERVLSAMQVSAKQHWSNRVQTKIHRLARTISDLAGDTHITDEAIWKAITLRPKNHQHQLMTARKS